MTSLAWRCRSGGQTGASSSRSLNPKAVPVIDPVSDVLEAMANAEVDQEATADAGALDDDYDAVFVSTGRSFPGGGSPASGRHCWRPTRGGVLSLAVMLLRPWKAPICARIGDQNPTPSVTGCC